MIPLAALFGAYLLSVLIGSRAHRMNGRITLLLLVLSLIQVAVVLAGMFTMDPPSMAPRGH